MNDIDSTETGREVNTRTWFKVEGSTSPISALDAIDQVQAINSFLMNFVTSSAQCGRPAVDLQNDEPFGLHVILMLANALLDNVIGRVEEDEAQLRQLQEPPKPPPLTPEQARERAIGTARELLKTLDVTAEQLLEAEEGGAA